MRTKNVELAELWFVTELNDTAWLPLGAVPAALPVIRSDPVVDVLAVQPVVAPRPDGCPVNVEPEIEKPAGVVQVPLAVVQAVNETDLIGVADGAVKAKA
jgi:hypothetical protein